MKPSNRIPLSHRCNLFRPLVCSVSSSWVGQVLKWKLWVTHRVTFLIGKHPSQSSKISIIHGLAGLDRPDRRPQAKRIT